jgi:hypothetical protein
VAPCRLDAISIRQSILPAELSLAASEGSCPAVTVSFTRRSARAVDLDCNQVTLRVSEACRLTSLRRPDDMLR